MQFIAGYCNKLQQVATNCNKLQQNAIKTKTGTLVQCGPAEGGEPATPCDSRRGSTCFGRSAAVFPRNPTIFARGRSRILLGQGCHRGAPASPCQTPTESRFPPKNSKRTLKNAFRGEIRSSLKRLEPVLAGPGGASVGSFAKHALNCADRPKKCSTASETYQNGSRTVRNKFPTPPGGLLVAGF